MMGSWFSLVSMLTDCVTLLNLLKLYGFRAQIILSWFLSPLMFLVCVLNPIEKIGHTTNILHKPRFHADRSCDRF